MSAFNLYGDSKKSTLSQFGVDIATQRADDLDKRALDRLWSIGPTFRALDAASASGGQALRMAKFGGTVVALDIDDYSKTFFAAAEQAGVKNNCSFEQADLTKFKISENMDPFDVIVCQRMIHYVPFSSARAIVRDFMNSLTEDGRLYLSASGVHSELGIGYTHAGEIVSRRYTELEPVMSEKHAIKGPVCLYSVADLAHLLEDAGMRVEQVFSSPFGNIKAVARR